MVRVEFSGDLQSFTQGVEELELPATNIRELLNQLEHAFPGLSSKITEEMAIAVDGVIYQDTLVHPLKEGCHVYFIPKIGAG